MGSGLEARRIKNRSVAVFDHISRVSVAFPSGACCTSVRLTVAPERRPKKEANPASLRSAAPSKGRGLRGYSLLPMEGGAPKGRRLDGDSGMKKSGEIVSSTPLTRAPYPPLARSPFPNGEGKEEAASPPQKRKPTPPRCARQPLPREGACVDTPSFLWKEVPRRGGGWMRMAV